MLKVLKMLILHGFTVDGEAITDDLFCGCDAVYIDINIYVDIYGATFSYK